mgnify:FL=1|jgi:DNA-binding GntR family transcriptional regulator
MSNLESIVDEVNLTLADRVFGQIQDAIVKGELKSGVKMSEVELTARYGVSRGPLREALRRLEARKLLTRIPHVGVRVVALTIDDVLQMYQVREVLEGMAARLAAQNATDEEVQGLKQLLQQHQQQTELQSGKGYYQEEGDFDFHYRIVKASRNDVLMQMLCGELYHRVRLYRYQFSVTEGRPHKAFAEHSRIIEAIEARDAELAEFLMRRHISSARNNIQTHYPSQSNQLR